MDLIGPQFGHGDEHVKHRDKEYVRGEIHSNTIEGFFSLMKHGVYGTWHSISRKQLFLYVAGPACEFRYNHGRKGDGARTLPAMRQADGMRLKYRQQTGC